ncbi:hypothetical protein C7M84_016692 [Penaeus vannamei]|uniref:Uncharacterized protein n=1 Tax=Penaeus vannamei TaxID=6689 RepID=A0A423SM51_PENVA|nr:hypothetical protein C7M84_016692 [Penaeus vannamei]
MTPDCRPDSAQNLDNTIAHKQPYYQITLTRLVIRVYRSHWARRPGTRCRKHAGRRPKWAFGNSPAGAQGPGASNSTGGEPSGSTGATGSGGQGPGVGATPDGGPSGSPETAAPEGQGPGGANSTGGVIDVTLKQFHLFQGHQGLQKQQDLKDRDQVEQIQRAEGHQGLQKQQDLKDRDQGHQGLQKQQDLKDRDQVEQIQRAEGHQGLQKQQDLKDRTRWSKFNGRRLVLRKVQFTDARTGKLYPCDLSQPPYVEIVDTYNNSISQRFCYLNEDVTIHSFGDQMFGYVVTNGDPNIIPDIRYNADMRCPYVFRLSFSPQCNVDYPECVIRLDFESFALSPNAMGRSRRQAESGNGTAATTQAPYVPPTGSTSTGRSAPARTWCGSVSATPSRRSMLAFCADNPPSQVYTGYKEVLLYFNSNDDRQNQGFVKPYDNNAIFISSFPLPQGFTPMLNSNRSAKERIPGRKTEKGRNEKKNAKGQAKEKKKGKKNRKMKEKQGKKKNRKMKKGKKSKKEEKKAEKAKRKGKLSNKKEKRLGNKKKNGKEVEDRAMNGGRTGSDNNTHGW